MSSVLNVGVMRGNPVGNQIRSLQNQLDESFRRMQLLLTALEAKSPEVAQEYVRLREEADKSIVAATPSSQPQPSTQRNPVVQQFQPSQPVRGGARF
jgi:hypothetical protein|uniref:Uncharacterized protein n=1 Tax=viral metagenome TaxID=1070528 RepID=A0A6C0HFL5_9ZZZZ